MRRRASDPNNNKTDLELIEDGIKYIINQYYKRCALRNLDYGEYEDPEMQQILIYFKQGGSLDDYFGERHQGRSVTSGQATVDPKYTGKALM